jgi:hypothetical protein
MVRRSQLKGDFNWVEIEGKLFANLCGLCHQCHDDVTGSGGGHKAAIRLLEGVYWWSSLEQKPNGEIVYMPFAPIEPQPPSPELAQRASSHATDSEHCPFCGQTQRRRMTAPPVKAGGRRRKTWTIKVPDDTEDGAAVLDALVEDAALLMGIEADANGRYYVIVPALVYVSQNWTDFQVAMQGMGG